MDLKQNNDSEQVRLYRGVNCHAVQFTASDPHPAQGCRPHDPLLCLVSLSETIF